MTPLIEHNCEIKMAACLEISREVDACAQSVRVHFWPMKVLFLNCLFDIFG